MRSRLLVVALLALSTFSAHAADHRLDVTFWGSFVAPTGSNVVNEASNVKLDFHAGGGVGLSATCHFTEALRLELGGSFWRTHGELRFANTAAADLGHLHAFPNFGLVQYHLVSPGLFTSFLSNPRTMKANSVFRLEPAPSDKCSGP